MFVLIPFYFRFLQTAHRTKKGDEKVYRKGWKDP